MYRTSHRLSSVLLVLGLAGLGIVFGACADAPAADAAEAVAPGSSSAASSTASSARSSKTPPLPDAASAEGDLPRTYLGFTLGDPPPAAAETLDGAPPFYPEATQHLVRLSESPKTNVSLYVHDGAVFRIEWRVKDGSLDRDAVAEAFSERLGPPEDSSQHVYWNDGLVDGSTTITVFRIDDSEWFRVAFEDTGRTSELLQRRSG